MNIGQTLRGLLGDTKAVSGVKSLELKEGQVVRASVVQISADQKEAVLQIKGVQVRAVLDTPMQQGDTALLQVGSPNTDGLMVMKPFEGNLAMAAPTIMTDLLSSLKLPDTKENRQLLITMQQSGIELTKENVKLIQNMLTAKPASVEPSQWINSVSLAMQRGLPVTAASVQALHMVLHGPTLDQLMSELDGMLQNMLTADSSEGEISTKTTGTMNGNLPSSLTSEMQGSNVSHVENLQGNVTLKEGKIGLTNTAQGNYGSPLTENESSSTGVLQMNTEASSLSTGMDMKKVEGASSGQGQILREMQGKELQGKTGTDLFLQVNENEAVDGESQKQNKTGAAMSRIIEQGALSVNMNGKNDGSRTTTQESNSLLSSGLAERSSMNAQAEPAGGAELLSVRSAASAGPDLAQRVVILLRELQAAPQMQLAEAAPASDGAAVQGTPQQEEGAGAQQPAPGNTPAPTKEESSWVGRVLKLLGAEHEQQVVRGLLTSAPSEAAPAAEHADTLKSLLMQVEASTELPTAVKETAGQLVHLLTGQQLLMNTDRTAPFAQMNWFIPISGAEGQLTANVHIQSQRGPRGELDASHCRIWFDLDMQLLGPTLIDMQVTGKVISLHIRTDHELSARIFDEGREQISSLLESAGYQLSVYRSEAVTRENTVHTQNSGTNVKQQIASYVPSAYKGVDMRI